VKTIKARKTRKARRRYRYRSAVWGRFVSEAYAKAHPRTTVRERVKP
jgi:hypothetical protein